MFTWIKKLFGKQEEVVIEETPVEQPVEALTEKPMPREAESEPKTPTETTTMPEPAPLPPSELPLSANAEIAFQQGFINTMKEVLAKKEEEVKPPCVEKCNGECKDETPEERGEYLWLGDRPQEDGTFKVPPTPTSAWPHPMPPAPKAKKPAKKKPDVKKPAPKKEVAATKPPRKKK